MSEPEYWISPKRVRFIPVKDGDVVELGDSGLPGVSGAHKLLGFKPGPGPKATGWIVVLISEDAPPKSLPRKHLAMPRSKKSMARVLANGGLR